MAVHDKDAPPVGGGVHRVRNDLDAAEIAGELRDKLIMVARDIDQPATFARLAEKFLDDVVVRLRPIATPPQRPDVDQVAYEIKRLDLVVAK